MHIDDIIFIGWLVFIVIFFLVNIFIKGYKRDAKQVGNTCVLTYSINIKLFVFIFTLVIPIMVTLGFIVGAFKPGIDTFIAYAVLTGFFIIVMLTFRHMFYFKVILSTDGIEKCRVWFKRQFVKWEDINSFRYSDSRNIYIIGTVGGKKLKISSYLNGRDSLIEYLKKYVGSEKLGIND